MAILHHRHIQSHLSLAAITFLLLASGSVLGSNPAFKFSVGGRKLRENMVEQVAYSRRRLGGPGSSPPTCRSKCGRCSPCTPVHVSIQPGLSVPLEYYPEAWRCKCRNKIFMP
ncbi:EPIDERMAL PATTERNING FACTOR-like protein 4 [Primulina eburnea]|uniref:EPIDERMAL PATTERNING FACTOR-like protein 4 n=1 Tax=Primulina eburnea TaxID=1245227 RepID=UPI003C6C1FA7